jgi:enamine deaminase RidA (YjgF/YER057c/UK114 family)
MVAAPGRLVYLAGQTAQDDSGVVRGDGMVEQFDRAIANLLAALRAAGGEPEQVVSLTVYVTDMDAYRRARTELGAVWRERFGRHYPAMALVGVTSLVDPAALVELQGVAVID